MDYLSTITARDLFPNASESYQILKTGDLKQWNARDLRQWLAKNVKGRWMLNHRKKDDYRQTQGAVLDSAQLQRFHWREREKKIAAILEWASDRDYETWWAIEREDDAIRVKLTF